MPDTSNASSESTGGLIKFDHPQSVSKTLKADGAAAGAKGSKLPPLQNKASQAQQLSIEEVLSSVMPPREWEDHGQLWTQKLSTAPATRLEVMELQDRLDQELQRKQARETGICLVRRELYDQCFDELIRQVAVNCQERGLLLLRVRDEIRMTMAAYQALYESSVAFGMRKALMAEQGRSDLEQKVVDLEKQNKVLEQQIQEWKSRCEAVEKRENERRQLDEKKHAEEISFLKKTNVQLKTQLESILSPQKK